MKVDLSKVTEILIKDSKGKVTERFKLSAAELLTYGKTDKLLVIHKA